MLRIAPSDSICFTHLGKEFIGTVEIANVIKTPVTFKVLKFCSCVMVKDLANIGVLFLDKNNFAREVSCSAKQRCY